MADGRTWRLRAADHWTKALNTSDPAQAYVNLMIAADCYARAVKADTRSSPDEPPDDDESPADEQAAADPSGDEPIGMPEKHSET